MAVRLLPGRSQFREDRAKEEVSAARSLSLDRLNRRLMEEVVPVTNDPTLTLIYDEDAGQVVLEGLPCGPSATRA
jgi:hypothetical protein